MRIFFWEMADVRSARWTKGRVVLLGDAAAAFLPTAGVGASMAMESAAVLADELSRTDVAGIEHAPDRSTSRSESQPAGTQVIVSVFQVQPEMKLHCIMNITPVHASVVGTQPPWLEPPIQVQPTVMKQVF